MPNAPDQPDQPGQSGQGRPGQRRRREAEEVGHPSPLLEHPPRLPPNGHSWPGVPHIGRADLDPFAAGVGGGMLFDPRDPRHFPVRPSSNSRGFIPSPSGPLHGIAAPPGARFDPYSPIDPPPPDAFRGGRSRGRRAPGNPDADHMRPPDYDDMFL